MPRINEPTNYTRFMYVPQRSTEANIVLIDFDQLITLRNQVPAVNWTDITTEVCAENTPVHHLDDNRYARFTEEWAIACGETVADYVHNHEIVGERRVTFVNRMIRRLGIRQDWVASYHWTYEYALNRLNDNRTSVIVNDPILDTSDLVFNSAPSQQYTGRSDLSYLATILEGMPDNTFGIEAEMLGNIDQHDTSRVIENETGITCPYRGYDHGNLENWKIVYDASVGNQNSVPYSTEIVSRVLQGNGGIQEIMDIIGTVSDNGEHRVNRQCGLHVHVSVGDETPLSEVFGITINWLRYEHIINGLISPSRRGMQENQPNAYCQDNRNHSTEGSMTVRDIQEKSDYIRSFTSDHYNRDSRYDYARSINGYDRYRKLNHVAYCKYQTLENRAHQGSCNPSKIVHWVMFNIAFVNRFMGTTELIGNDSIDPQTDFDFLMNELAGELPEAYRQFFVDYWTDRWTHFDYFNLNQASIAAG